MQATADPSTSTLSPPARDVVPIDVQLSKLVSASGGGPELALAIHLPDGRKRVVGRGEPILDIHVQNQQGLRALLSTHQLQIADAYVAGDLEFEGDLITALTLKASYSDRAPWLKLWRNLQPRLLGRPRCNPEWIAKHYDLENIQLAAADKDYDTYTPGIYLAEEEPLEPGAERKLKAAFAGIQAKSGDSVLDIGCGWGGFMRFASRRGVRVTGLTLSRNQLEYDQKLIAQERLNAEVLFQDFFTYEPGSVFDGIVMMGVMEDLSDYHRVLQRLTPWLRAGARIYCDFASGEARLETGSFVTKYVYPGTFRMVHMPEFVDAVDRSQFEIRELHNDRWNYYVWSKQMHDRWVERKQQILERSAPELWRMLRLLYAGCASIMMRPYGRATAYRLVLERF